MCFSYYHYLLRYAKASCQLAENCLHIRVYSYFFPFEKVKNNNNKLKLR